MKTVTALTTALTLLSTTAFAQVYTFRDLDSDGNLELSDREFIKAGQQAYEAASGSSGEGISEEDYDRLSEKFSRLGDQDFARWDTNDSGRMELPEFTAVLYTAYDTDANERMSQEEYQELEPQMQRQNAGTAQSAGTTRTAGMSESAGAASRSTADTSTDAGKTRITPDDSSSGDALRARITSLDSWSYDQLYAGGASAERMIDDTDLYGPGGDEIGQIEDILLGSDGKIVALIAEVGGFWDIGDTHVSIPWEDVEMSGNRVTVPITEENADEYGVFDNERIARSEAAATLVGGVDDALAGNRLWRASELIGDYARLRDRGSYQNYGYVQRHHPAGRRDHGRRGRAGRSLWRQRLPGLPLFRLRPGNRVDAG